jgi:hypothetical protein
VKTSLPEVAADAMSPVMLRKLPSPEGMSAALSWGDPQNYAKTGAPSVRRRRQP